MDDEFNVNLRDNLNTNEDPFGNGNPDQLGQVPKNQQIADPNVHIWIRQRGRKHVTTLSNLSEERVPPGLEEMCKTLKKKFACIGKVKPDKESGGKIVEFSGDQRENIRKFLVEKKIVELKDLNIHGF